LPRLRKCCSPLCSWQRQPLQTIKLLKIAIETHQALAIGLIDSGQLEQVMEMVGQIMGFSQNGHKTI